MKTLFVLNIEEIYLQGINIKHINLLHYHLILQSSEIGSIRECNYTIDECNAKS